MFFYMVASKIQLLLSKDNKVDVDVDYPSQLPFPAVTVCNLNKYRYVFYACLDSFSLGDLGSAELASYFVI
jgi:Amiloride-sensitive sodium channel